ncbi:unnamed protein product [Linum trigynum]|uniref:Uncharacterized protein n=1 Tax=Linum trigynum TaxID=586398 RepID=A0AAV2D7C9_9ROSI
MGGNGGLGPMAIGARVPSAGEGPPGLGFQHFNEGMGSTSNWAGVSGTGAQGGRGNEAQGGRSGGPGENRLVGGRLGWVPQPGLGSTSGLPTRPTGMGLGIFDNSILLILKLLHI